MQVLQTLLVTALVTNVAQALVGPVVQQSSNNAPTVALKNGSYYGRYQSTYRQDLFLGIPYAKPPVGDLRFQNPQPLNTTWTTPKNATEYSPMCYGYGSDTWVLGNVVSEDCLTLNVIRPRSVATGANLPVAFWIHGGGLLQGGSRDPRYNMSFMIDQGVQMNKPFIGVSINYRLHGFGFLWGSAVRNAGVANLGLKDQRLAMQWVHDNIAAFGGDPKKVTIFGESAGARSVGCQLIAYGGRDDGLFRGAIMASRDVVFPTSAYVTEKAFDSVYNNIAKAAGCGDANDTLECLRQVPVNALSSIFNSSVASGQYLPVIDGDFIPQSGLSLLSQGKFVHVPLMHGQNNDEGSAFVKLGINTEDDFLNYVKSSGYTNEQANIFSKLYPDIPSIGIPSTLHGRPAAGSSLGVMYKRAAAYQGDVGFHAGRRYTGQIWSKNNLTVYNYNFNVLVNGMADHYGATHFQEVAFIFYNLQGEGYKTAVAVNPFANKPPSYARLAKIMSRMWISFFVDQTPNNSGQTNVVWPVYKGDDAEIVVFDTNKTASLLYSTPDTYRAEAIAYIHSQYNLN